VIAPREVGTPILIKRLAAKNGGTSDHLQCLVLPVSFAAVFF